MAVLECLANAGGSVVSRNELFDTVWPGALVSDDALTQCIVELRKALGDTARDAKVIETIPKMGFRLVPTVMPLGHEAPGMPVSVAMTDVDSAEAIASQTNHRWLTPRAAFVIFAALLCATILIWYQSSSRDRQRTFVIDDKNSVAVLPFDDWGEDSAPQEYISLGLIDDVLTNLSRISKLRVTSRSSSMRYRFTDKSIQQIGRELGVGNVLQGSIRYSGSKIKVSVQLIRVADDKHLWANDYVRDIQPGESEYFEVTGDLARNIARNLNVKILGEEDRRIGQAPTDNPMAYDLFSRARLLTTNNLTADELTLAIDYLERAIALDPEFAHAHAELADAYEYLLQVGNRSNDPETHNKVKIHTRLAMELDPDFAKPYVTLAQSQMDSLDFLGAKQSIEKALELNNNLAHAHGFYGVLLSTLFEHEEAIEHAKIAAELQPLNPKRWAGDLGNRYRQAGEFQKAIEVCQHALELNKDFWPALWFMGGTYAQAGNYTRAIELLEEGYQVSGEVNAVAAALAFSYGKNGDTDKTRTILAKFEQNNASPINKAIAYIGLGDKEQALSAIEVAFQQRDDILSVLPQVHYYFGPLNNEPRYKVVWEKMGLGRAWSKMIKQHQTR
jgi:adenylate cyclase